MELTEYLTENDESQKSFAKRTGIPQTTINTICQGGGTYSATAYRIIRATGGLVTLEDLRGEDSKDRAAS